MVAHCECDRWRVAACNGRVPVWHFDPSVDHRGGWLVEANLLLHCGRQRISVRTKSKRGLVRHFFRVVHFAQSIGANGMAKRLGQTIRLDCRRVIFGFQRAMVEINFPTSFDSPFARRCRRLARPI